MKTPLLHYERHGDGRQPLVLLHGFLSDGRDWLPSVNRLADKFRFLTIDLPGHGRSRKIGLEYNFAQTSAAIVAILNKEKITRCALLGYSMGGRIALYTALSHPERFSHLILESASAGINDATKRQNRLIADQKLAEKLMRAPLADFLRDWYNQPLFDTLRAHPDFPALVKRRLENDPDALSRALQNLGAGVMPPLWEKLQKINMPFHFIFGDKDEKYRAIAAEMRAYNARIFLHEIKGSGHNTHFENPTEFCNVLAEIFANEE